MKKGSVGIVIILSLFLSGCMNQASAKVVEDMYNAALVENEEYIRGIYAEHYEDIDENLDEVMGKLTTQVRSMQGVKNMSITELRHRQLQPEVIKNLDERYDKNWYLVVARLDDNSVMLWILQADGYYFIADGQKLSNEEYNNEILD
ncbi:hypothetical protein [Virgibacillus ainsalahensis]